MHLETFRNRFIIENPEDNSAADNENGSGIAVAKSCYSVVNKRLYATPYFAPNAVFRKMEANLNLS